MSQHFHCHSATCSMSSDIWLHSCALSQIWFYGIASRCDNAKRIENSPGSCPNGMRDPAQHALQLATLFCHLALAEETQKQQPCQATRTVVDHTPCPSVPQSLKNQPKSRSCNAYRKLSLQVQDGPWLPQRIAKSCLQNILENILKEFPNKS